MRLLIRQLIVLMAFMLSLQGVFCHTMPEQKLRIIRDTQGIPTHLFQPVGAKSGGVNSSRRNETAGGDSEGEVTLLEKSNGAVETNGDYSDEEDDDEYSNQPRRFPPPQRFNPNNFPRTNGFPQRSFDNRGPNFITGANIDPRIPFSPISSFPRSSSSSIPLGSFNFPDPRIPNTPSWRPNPIPIPSQSSITPFISNGPRGSSFSNGPSGSSSDNFFRSESYSFSSDGSGPPQIEQSVYDSRNGFGASSRRNF